MRYPKCDGVVFKRNETKPSSKQNSIGKAIKYSFFDIEVRRVDDWKYKCMDCGYAFDIETR